VGSYLENYAGRESAASLTVLVSSLVMDCSHGLVSVTATVLHPQYFCLIP
jgi:hypothetical protein